MARVAATPPVTETSETVSPLPDNVADAKAPWTVGRILGVHLCKIPGTADAFTRLWPFQNKIIAQNRCNGPKIIARHQPSKLLNNSDGIILGIIHGLLRREVETDTTGERQ